MIFLSLALIGFWPWAVLVTASILLIACLEFEMGSATLAVLAFGAVGLWVVNFGLFVPNIYECFQWIGQHWLHIVYFVLAYAVIGGVWSVVKWFFYVHSRDDEYEANKARYQKEWDSEQFRNSSFRVLGEYVCPRTYPEYVQAKYDFPPNWKRSKARLTSWIAYWPWSALWTLINDPFKRVVRFVYKSLGGIYSSISASIFAKHAELKS